MRTYWYVLILTLTLSITNTQAQDSEDVKPALSVGYTYSAGHFLQIGALYGKNYGNVHSPSLGVGIGVDLGTVNKEFTLGTRAFAEYNLLLATIRLGMVNYTRQKQNDLRFLPEVGLTVFGHASITYGYSIPFKENDISEIGQHRLSLNINFFKKSRH